MTAQAMTVSTAEISPGDRIEFWEDWNRSCLVGLRCSTLRAAGLRVSARQRVIDEVTFTEISGDQHTVERSERALRQRPGDAIFVSILTSGSAFFTSPEGIIVAQAGESILYSTDQPYLFGFDRSTSQVILTVPMDLAYGDWGFAPLGAPRLLAPDQSRRLQAAVSGIVDCPAPDAQRAAIPELMREVAGGSSPLAALRGAAFAVIRRRLCDPRLTPVSLSQDLGVSERQLRRVFADGGESPATAIQGLRLAAARRRLRQDPRPTVSEVSAEFGFASPAHFARVFRARYGMTPSEARAGRSPLDRAHS
mgnify:CR=1 FL=1